eukprot:3013139-Pleurochrysis_carterae.AAC.1
MDGYKLSTCGVYYRGLPWALSVAARPERARTLKRAPARPGAMCRCYGVATLVLSTQHRRVVRVRAGRAGVLEGKW